MARRIGYGKPRYLKSGGTSTERAHATTRLRRITLTHHDVLSEKQKKMLERRLVTLKVLYDKKIQSLEATHRSEKARWQEKIRDQVSQNNANFDREFSRLKRHYQLNLEQVKDIYHRQNTFFASEMKAFVHDQKEMNRKEYEIISANSQKQLMKYQRWLQDELIPQLIDKKQQIERSEAERVKLDAELIFSRLVKHLDERNSEIEQSKERIKRLEEKATKRHQRPAWARMRWESYVEPPIAHEDTEPRHDEILSIIKEIARERAQINQSREVADDDYPAHQSASPWASK